MSEDKKHDKKKYERRTILRKLRDKVTEAAISTHSNAEDMFDGVQGVVVLVIAIVILGSLILA